MSEYQVTCPKLGIRQLFSGQAFKICFEAENDDFNIQEKKSFLLNGINAWTSALGDDRFPDKKIEIEFVPSCGSENLKVKVSQEKIRATANCGVINISDSSNESTVLHELGHAFIGLGDTYVEGSSPFCQPGQLKSVMCNHKIFALELQPDDIEGAQSAFDHIYRQNSVLSARQNFINGKFKKFSENSEECDFEVTAFNSPESLNAFNFSANYMTIKNGQTVSFGLMKFYSHQTDSQIDAQIDGELAVFGTLNGCKQKTFFQDPKINSFIANLGDKWPACKIDIKFVSNVGISSDRLLTFRSEKNFRTFQLIYHENSTLDEAVELAWQDRDFQKVCDIPNKDEYYSPPWNEKSVLVAPKGSFYFYAYFEGGNDTWMSIENRNLSGPYPSMLLVKEDPISILKLMRHSPVGKHIEGKNFELFKQNKPLPMKEPFVAIISNNSEYEQTFDIKWWKTR